MMSEKERNRLQKELMKVGNGFLKVLREVVDSCVLHCDVDRLGRLVTQVQIVTAAEVVNTIRDKGFSKELTELCDKVGRLKEGGEGRGS